MSVTPRHDQFFAGLRPFRFTGCSAADCPTSSKGYSVLQRQVTQSSSRTSRFSTNGMSASDKQEAAVVALILPAKPSRSAFFSNMVIHGCSTPMRTLTRSYLHYWFDHWMRSATVLKTRSFGTAMEQSKYQLRIVRNLSRHSRINKTGCL